MFDYVLSLDLRPHYRSALLFLAGESMMAPLFHLLNCCLSGNITVHAVGGLQYSGRPGRIIHYGLVTVAISVSMLPYGKGIFRRK